MTGMTQPGAGNPAPAAGFAVHRYPVNADTYGWGPGYAPAGAHLCEPENATDWLTEDEIKAVGLLDDETDLADCHPTLSCNCWSCGAALMESTHPVEFGIGECRECHAKRMSPFSAESRRVADEMDDADIADAVIGGAD